MSKFKELVYKYNTENFEKKYNNLTDDDFLANDLHPKFHCYIEDVENAQRNLEIKFNNCQS